MKSVLSKAVKDIDPMELTQMQGPSGAPLLGFQKATREEALRMRDDLNNAIKESANA